MTLKKLRVENLADSKCKFFIISYLSVIPLKSLYRKLHLGPVTRIRIFENGDFLSLLSTRKRRFAALRKGFPVRVEFFKNAVLTKTEVFEYDDIIHHTAHSVSDKYECYRNSIVLAFPCGRAKTIRVRYVWTRIFSKLENKISVFSNIRIRADGGLTTFLLIFIHTLDVKNAFTIVSPKRLWLCQAHSWDQKFQWLSVLENSIAAALERV